MPRWKKQCLDTDFVAVSIKRLAKDKVMWAVNIFTILKLAPLSVRQLLIVLGMAVVSVFWYEVVKMVKNKNKYWSVNK